MEVKLQRNKSYGRECDLGTRQDKLNEAISLVVNDLQWGGKVTDNGDNIVIRSVVFGDVDLTTVSGEDFEMNIMRQVLKAYGENKTKSVTEFLITAMGFKPEPMVKYSFEDTCLVYGMFLEGERSSDLIFLISKKEYKLDNGKPNLTQEKIDEVIDLKKKLNLGPEDGVNGILAGMLLGA